MTDCNLILSMAKGKSITRETRLRNLKNRGMDYYPVEGYFSCKYCEIDINSPKI